MPEHAAGGGGDRLTLIHRCQVLASEFAIETNSLALLMRVHDIAQGAVQHIDVVSHRRFSVWQTEDEFRIEEEGAAVDVELTARHAAVNVSERIFRHALADMPDHISLRAAVVSHAGRTLLLAGPRKSGKTALALRLMFAGYDVAGDDIALVRHGQAIAFPSKFSVVESTATLLPQLQSVCDVTPFGPNPAYDWRFDVAPPSFGRRWLIAPAAVDAIFSLEPNFGARTEAVPAGKIETIRRLVTIAGAPPSQPRDWIGDLSRTVDRAQTFTLRLGDLDTAVLAIEGALC